MKRLKLDLDDLQIESFLTQAPREVPGTVRGHVPPSAPEGTCGADCTPLYTVPYTCANTCNDDSCNGVCPTLDGGSTCAASCNGTCGRSCLGTCDEYTCRVHYCTIGPPFINTELC